MIASWSSDPMICESQDLQVVINGAGVNFQVPYKVSKQRGATKEEIILQRFLIRVF